MSENTKSLRVRIKSVNSTLQLTKAMGLVASSKIRRANDAMLKGREYLSALENTISLLTSDRECAKSPYMQKREPKKTRIIIIAGDRGLAGGYNANVFRLAATLGDAEFIPIGKRACERYSNTVISSEKFSYSDAAKLADTLCSDFEEQKFDRLGIIYTKYISVMAQEAHIKWVLPFEKSESEGASSVIFEPNQLTVLNNAARECVAGTLTACVRESFASEVSARRMAMDSAGKNAKEMIDELQLRYNRARQGAITQEITEIVAGSGS
ncbi:MAG: ATP synthase F1 subunit gamma [Clostridia bacterium]|nr:ATP synthase F1 subunit gamma [Clostridia bacterium]